MTTQTIPVETPSAPAANAGEAGSGQPGGEGGAGSDGQGAQGATGSEGGEAGASGAGGDAGAGDAGKPAGESGEPATGEAAGDKGDQAPTELVLPEGIEVSAEWRAELDTLASTIETLTPLARQQAIVDAGIKFRAEIEAQLAGDTNERIAQWAESAKADPVIGGAKFEENLMVAQQAFTTYGDPELKQFLIESGLGNHPALLRWAFKVGNASREKGVVHGLGAEAPRAPANTEAAMAERMIASASKPNKKLPPGA